MEVTLNKKTKAALSVAAIALFLVFVYLGDIMISPGSSWKMLITVIEKGSIYALVAASMNLLNGFTGLFSLGQAGFMLIGAYTYAIFTIPAASHDAVYQYFEGGVIKWSIVEMLEGSLGVFGHYLGMLIPMLGAGLLVAVIAFLIAAPVQLRGNGEEGDLRSGVRQDSKGLRQIDGIRHRGWSLRGMLFGSGGMPSSHTAFVAALTTMAGLKEGFDSLPFAICFVMMFIVMTDAIGVRRETGRQGSAINILMDWFMQETDPETENQDLKERMGHSPLEVLVGFLWGIGCALLYI